LTDWSAAAIVVFAAIARVSCGPECGLLANWMIPGKSEMAVIAFPNGRATLLETGPGVTVEQIVAATEAKLALPDTIPEMRL
jgi:acyl CoA:acetate/3-ketoacid CoA transferase beta subunit